MASWSAENATKAYLQALKMGKMGKEPSLVEFLAALAAGNNSQLMVIAWGSGGSATATATALVCASRQTGGRVVCICRHSNEVAAARESVGRKGDSIEFVVGDVWELLSSDYLNADFVLIDCRLSGDQEGVVFPVGWGGGAGGGAVAVGHNTVQGNDYVEKTTLVRKMKKKRGWVFEVDEFTGEEHFYKITSPRVR